MICITSQKQRKSPLKYHQGQKWGLVLFSFNNGRIITLSENSRCNALRIPNSLEWPCCTGQFMFPDSSFDVSCKRSAWALQNSPYQDWKLPTQWSLPQGQLSELSVPGLNWIIIQTLPTLPAFRIWITSNRELSLKDAPDPSQQRPPKLWQRHRVSTGTLFSNHNYDIFLDDQDAK